MTDLQLPGVGPDRVDHVSPVPQQGRHHPAPVLQYGGNKLHPLLDHLGYHLPADLHAVVEDGGNHGATVLDDGRHHVAAGLDQVIVQIT